MPVEHTKYSQDGYRVVAIYQLDDTGEIVLDTLRYAVMDSEGNTLRQFSSLPAAVTELNRVVAEKHAPASTPWRLMPMDRKFPA